MKITCTLNKNFKDITIGKEYKVFKAAIVNVTIFNDKNLKVWYPNKCFGLKEM